MFKYDTPQPVILIKSAIVDELLRINASDVQGEQSLSMVQAKSSRSSVRTTKWCV